MSVIKKYAHKQKGYESISRNMLQDRENLSLQAIGLLAHIQSLPDTWTINKTELYKRFAKNGRTSVQNAWNELIQNNYVLQFRKRVGKKNLYTYYFTHEKFSIEDIKNIERMEGCSVWDGRATTSINKDDDEKSRLDGISSTVDFEQSKLGSSKRADNKLNLKEIDPKDNTDTKDTKETKIDSSVDSLSESQKEKKKDQYLKNSLKDSENIPDRLFQILDVFSEDYNQMYRWIGIIFRAKSNVEKLSGQNILLENEQHEEWIHHGIAKVMRNFKKQKMKNLDGYMYTSLVQHLEQEIVRQERVNTINSWDQGYHYLDENNS